MTICDPKLQDEFCSQQNDARYRSTSKQYGMCNFCEFSQFGVPTPRCKIHHLVLRLLMYNAVLKLARQDGQQPSPGEQRRSAQEGKVTSSDFCTSAQCK